MKFIIIFSSFLIFADSLKILNLTDVSLNDKELKENISATEIPEVSAKMVM